MKNVACERCGAAFPMNETLNVRGVLVCRACAEAIFKTEKIQRNQVQKQIDPTICIGCGLDNGDDDLATLGQLPVCPACETLFKNRPFPGWVKAGLAAMVILVLSILMWNSRFIRAYYELRCFASEMAVGDLQSGAPHFISASRLVPENAELQAYGPFYEGLVLLGQDKSAEALKLLQSCVGRVAPETNIDGLIMDAKVGVAFDKGDYDQFLKLALEMEAKHKDDPVYAEQLASAYACKYAETQDEQYKTKSLAALDRSKTLVSSKPEYQTFYADYQQRILHRLYTREIISRSEFQKRYPNGWAEEGQEL